MRSWNEYRLAHGYTVPEVENRDEPRELVGYGTPLLGGLISAMSRASHLRSQLTAAVPALGGRVYPLWFPQNVLYPAVPAISVSARNRGIQHLAADASAGRSDDPSRLVFGAKVSSMQYLRQQLNIVRGALQRQTSRKRPCYVARRRVATITSENSDLYRTCSIDVRVW